MQGELCLVFCLDPSGTWDLLSRWGWGDEGGGGGRGGGLPACYGVLGEGGIYSPEPHNVATSPFLRHV